jgi:hypothetical protein
LEQAHVSACGLSSKTEEVMSLREQNTLPRRQKTEAKTDAPSKSNVAKAKKVIVDITRPQHPEFEFQLRELQSAINLPNRIADPDLLRRAADEEDPIEYLRRSEILCDSPLEQFN